MDKPITIEEKDWRKLLVGGWPEMTTIAIELMPTFVKFGDAFKIDLYNARATYTYIGHDKNGNVRAKLMHGTRRG